MARFLTILLLLDAIILAGAVLLQAGKGGGLAASFGGAGSSPNSLLGSREAGNLLTKTSWWAGGIFLGLAFILQLASSNKGQAPKSVLDPTGNAAKAPVGGPPATNAGQTAPLQPVAPVVPPGTDVMKKAPGAKQPDGKKTPPPAKPPTENRP